MDVFAVVNVAITRPKSSVGTVFCKRTCTIIFKTAKLKETNPIIKLPNSETKRALLVDKNSNPSKINCISSIKKGINILKANRFLLVFGKKFISRLPSSGCKLIPETTFKRGYNE